MFEYLKQWYLRYFSDPQASLLALLLVLGFTLVLTLGKMLAPVFAALVIAYLLEGIVQVLRRQKVRRIRAVVLVFSLFIAFVLFLLLWLVPIASKQLTELVREFPNYITSLQQALVELPKKYSFMTRAQAREISVLLNKELADNGQRLLALSVSSIPGLISLAVYLVLVPMLVFFFLKDKWVILNYLSSFLPSERSLPSAVWKELDLQLGNYIRGKFWEMLIVTTACMLAFWLMGLKYALLLSVLVGISVLVPYVGATIVTIPVVFIAYIQWGWTADFAYLMLVYGVIQAIDGTVLVPLLFAEVVNLHPIAIIVSILFFGGLWGFWGLFFAIPLATLVNATASAWPRSAHTQAGNTTI